jgi:hypothetical protein
MRSRFEIDAAVVRRVRIGAGLGALVGAWLLALWCVGMLDVVRERLGLFHMGTARYRHAQWASTVAVAAFAAALGSAAVLLVGRSARAVLGLPPMQRGRSERRIGWALIVMALPAGATLGVWSIDEVLVRDKPLAQWMALGLGLLLTLVFAYDVPWLVRKGRAALRALAPLARVPFRRMDALRSGERARMRGKVMALGEPLRVPEGDCVYRRTLGTDLPGGAGEAGAPLEARPFLLRGESGSVRVELDERAVVAVREVEREGTRMALLFVGDDVDVIGDCEGGEDAYRAVGPSIRGGERPLFVLTGGRMLRTRLVLAAAVELGSAVALAAWPLGLAGLFVWTAMLARQ